MLPLMIRAGSADVGAGGWLAAANYAGYLLGALTAARLPLSPQRTGLLSLAVIVGSTAAMGLVDSLAAWLLLRGIAGVASAWALVSTSVWCLSWLARLGRPNGAGMVYAGVGAGIALAGLYCWRAGAADVAPDRLWLHLGLLALVGSIAVAALMPREAGPVAAAATGPGTRGAAAGDSQWDLVICYGMLGFGYILPATFLPVLARAVVDNPAVFGAAWPVFGAAAALSTLLAGALLSGLSRRHVLAGSHLLMALGCLLPVLHLSAGTVLAAALLVGGTFMVITMIAMQEARARAEQSATAILARMTAGFAFGQLMGPIVSAVLGRLTADYSSALNAALLIAASGLIASAIYLRHDAHRQTYLKAHCHG